MSESYTVRVAKDSHAFSAGHFITFSDGQCERVHGHNYRVAVEVTAPLEAGAYVFDFLALRDRLRELTDELDHRMLLPGESELIKVEHYDGSTWVRFEKRRWAFPTDECVVLPLSNTTTELLARYLGQRLLAALRERHGFVPERMAVEVEENVGLTARWVSVPASTGR